VVDKRSEDSSRGRWAVLALAAVLFAGCATSGPTSSAAISIPATTSVPVATVAPTVDQTAITPSSDASLGPSDTPSASPSASPPRPIPGEPDPALTPGATNPGVTQANIAATICVSGWTATVRPPAAYTTALKIRQIVAYGYADSRTADYEEDHLVSLELGGAPRDPKNLWPEPYAATLPDGTPVGARVKDQVENYLHRKVCSGRMTLAAAQELIARDWESAMRAAGPGN
jgi:hypothetical protein